MKNVPWLWVIATFLMTLIVGPRITGAIASKAG